jgi:hypothetical protein
MNNKITLGNEYKDSAELVDFIGVRVEKVIHNNKAFFYWMSDICTRKGYIPLGHFDTPEQAQEAYFKKLITIDDDILTEYTKIIKRKFLDQNQNA